jgi:hypothetical protein
VPSSRIEQIPDDGIPRRTQKKKSLELVGVSEPEERIKIAAVLGKRLPGENPEAVKLMLQGILAYTGGAPGGIMRWMRGLPGRKQLMDLLQDTISRRSCPESWCS